MWVLSAIFRVSVREKLIEAAQVGPRHLVLTKGRHWRRRGGRAGQAAHLAGDPLRVQLAPAQARRNGWLDLLQRVFRQQLQDAGVVPPPGRWAVARLQRL